MNWYIEERNISKISKNTRDKVKESAGLFMEVFNDKLCELEDFNLDNINKMLHNLVEEFPVMTPKNDWKTGEFYIRYNSYFNIKLKDPLKSIYRDLKLNQLLNE